LAWFRVALLRNLAKMSIEMVLRFALGRRSSDYGPTGSGTAESHGE